MISYLSAVHHRRCLRYLGELVIAYLALVVRSIFFAFLFYLDFELLFALRYDPLISVDTLLDHVVKLFGGFTHELNADRPLSQSLFLQWVINSVIVTFFAMLGDVEGIILVAYDFSSVYFLGRYQVFILVLITLMLRFHVVWVHNTHILEVALDRYLLLLIVLFLSERALYIFILR